MDSQGGVSSFFLPFLSLHFPVTPTFEDKPTTVKQVDHRVDL